MPKAALESWNRGRRQGLKGSTTSYAIVNSLERDPLIPLHHVKTFIMNCEMHVPKMASLHVHSCTAWYNLLIFNVSILSRQWLMLWSIMQVLVTFQIFDVECYIHSH
jgi:hypothetical protein